MNANSKSTMGFSTSHQPRSCIIPNFPKMGFRYRNVFCRNFDQKPLKVCYKVSLSKNFQWQSCCAIRYLPNGINILVGDDPISIKFGPKGTNPNRKDAHFPFHMRHAMQSAIANLVLYIIVACNKI